MDSRKCACVFSRVQLFVTSWTVAHPTPLSMGFPKQECWGGLPFSSQGNLPNPGLESESPVSSALGGRFFTAEPPREPRKMVQKA